MSIGAMAAIVHGVTVPFLVVVMGETADVLSNEFLTRQLARSFDNISVSDINCTQLNAVCDLIQDCQFFVDNSLCTTKDELIDQINQVVLYYCVLGVVLFIGGTFHSSLFQYACERQIHVIRVKFFRSVLRQDISWFDANTAGELNSRWNK